MERTKQLESALSLKEYLCQFTDEKLAKMSVYIGYSDYEEPAKVVDFDDEDIIISVN